MVKGDKYLPKFIEIDLKKQGQAVFLTIEGNKLNLERKIFQKQKPKLYRKGQNHADRFGKFRV